MNDMIAEEIATIGKAIGRAQAQLAEDEASGYDVLAIDDPQGSKPTPLIVKLRVSCMVSLLVLVEIWNLTRTN